MLKKYRSKSPAVKAESESVKPEARRVPLRDRDTRERSRSRSVQRVRELLEKVTEVQHGKRGRSRDGRVDPAAAQAKLKQLLHKLG